MLRLMLLFVGTPVARRFWWVLVTAGFLGVWIAGALFVDGLRGIVHFPIRLFGIALVGVGLVTTLSAFGTAGVRRRLRIARALSLVCLGLMVLTRPLVDDMVVAVGFGLLYTFDGVFRLAAAAVIRFEGWGSAMLFGVGELCFAAFIFEPYPTHYAGTVPVCLAFPLFLAALVAVRLGMRLRAVRPGQSLAYLLSRSTIEPDDVRAAVESPQLEGEVGAIVVHVWTPAGAIQSPERRLAIDRYVAAVDDQGVVSTGHAALDGGADLYISHYPGREFDRSPDDFASALRATDDNDVTARFLPSYAEEAAGWCDSTEQVRFEGVDVGRLRAFWHRYRARSVYNLTRRNCATTTTLALETALEGWLARKGITFGALVRMFVSPELWVASQLRKRAEMMTWTPGIALDYARALFGVMREGHLGLSENVEHRRVAKAQLAELDAEHATRATLVVYRRSHVPPEPVVEAPAPPRSLFSIGAVVTTAAIFGLTYGLAAPLIAEDLDRSGRGPLFIGLNAAMHAVGVLGIAPFLPALAARFGSRRLIAGALVLTSLCLPMFAVAPTVWLWFPLRVLMGISAEVLLVMSESWANELSSPKTRGRTMAFYTGALSLGFAGGPAILSVVGGSHVSYMIGGGIALLALGPILHPRAVPPPAMSHTANRTLFYFFAAPLAMGAAFLNAAVETAGLSFMPSYAMSLGFSDKSALRLVSTLLVGALVMQAPVGYLADKVRPLIMLVTLATVSSISAACWPLLLASPTLAFATVFLWGGAFVGMYTVILTDIGNRFKGTDLVGIYSVMSVFWGIGALVGPSVVGAAVVASPALGLPMTVAAGCAFFLAFVIWDHKRATPLAARH